MLKSEKRINKVASKLGCEVKDVKGRVKALIKNELKLVN